MKIALLAVLVSSLSFAMQQNPKNMSREMLEQKLQEAQHVINSQQETIARQKVVLQLVYYLHYGTPLEKASARADLQKAQELFYITKYTKVVKK